MFRIEKAFSKGPMGDDRMVVDHERGVWLQKVSTFGPEPGDAMKLVWHERVIPFDVLRDSHEDNETGETYYLTRFLSFGGSAYAQIRGGISPYQFNSPGERREAQLLAVEALLLYSSHYNGDKRSEGYDRIEFEGRIYTRKDFGIP